MSRRGRRKSIVGVDGGMYLEVNGLFVVLIRALLVAVVILCPCLHGYRPRSQGSGSSNDRLLFIPSRE